MVLSRLAEIRQYCYLDCISTFLLLHKVQANFILIAQKLHIILPADVLRRRFTASGIGFWFFVQGFFKRNMTNRIYRSPNPPFVNNEPQRVYEHQRAAYYGGIVQVFRHEWRSKTYVVDVNSMYPAMLRRKLPWEYLYSQPVSHNLREILRQPESDLYLFEVDYYSLPNTFKGAFIATKQDPAGKNTYFNDYGTLGQCYLHGVTLKRLLHHRGDVSATMVHRYASGGNMCLKAFA